MPNFLQKVSRGVMVPQWVKRWAGVVLGSSLALTVQAAGSPGRDLPGQELTPQIIYQLLLGEIAGAEGQGVLASQVYLELAKHTKDPRIAERATEMSLFFRQLNTAQEADRLWLEIEPKSARAKELQALIKAGTQALMGELESKLAKLLASQPDQLAEVLLRLNTALAPLPDRKQTQQLVTKLTAPYLHMPEAWFARAQASAIAGMDEQAIQEFTKALVLRPEWEQVVLAKAQLEARSKPEVAVQTLERFQAGHTVSRDYQLMYARALVSAKQFESALAKFQQLLSADPENGDLLFAVGMLALQLERYPEAKTTLEKIVSLKQTHTAAATMYLGELAERDNQTEQALAYYRSIPAGEQYIPAQLRMAQLLLRQDRWAEAELVLEEALKQQPDNPDILYDAAMLAEKQGKYEVMESRLLKVQALSPANAHAFNALGYSLVERNLRLADARPLLEKALALAPRDPLIMDSYAWLLYREGKFADAANQLRHALVLRDDPEIIAHLAEVLWHQGGRSDARGVVQDGLQRHPGNLMLRKLEKDYGGE